MGDLFQARCAVALQLASLGSNVGSGGGFRSDRDTILAPEARGQEFNPVTEKGLGCKIGLDATARHPAPPAFDRVKMKEADLGNYEIEEP